MTTVVPETIGRYEILGPLGAGGMAQVYLARVRGLEDFEQRYAVKVIHADMEDQEQFIRAFIDEARIAVQLDHPNIVQVHDLGRCDRGPFMGMEYVEGPNLERVIIDSYRIRGSVPFNLGTFVICEVLRGLAHAHEATLHDGTHLGIVHRDISPANILLGLNGAVKLADFGVARAAIASHAQEAGYIVGKASFMAPEVTRGEIATPRSDVFSLGAVMFLLFTGEPLITGSSFKDRMERMGVLQIDQRLEDVFSLPTGLEDIIRKALQQDPERRFASAREMLDQLDQFVFDQRLHCTMSQLGSYLGGLTRTSSPPPAQRSSDEPGPMELSLGEPSGDETRSGAPPPLDSSVLVVPATAGATVIGLLPARGARCLLVAVQGDQEITIAIDHGVVVGFGPAPPDAADALQGLVSLLARLLTGPWLVRRLEGTHALAQTLVPAAEPLADALLGAARQVYALPWFVDHFANQREARLHDNLDMVQQRSWLRLHPHDVTLARTLGDGRCVVETITGPDGRPDDRRSAYLFRLLVLGALRVEGFQTAATAPAPGPVDPR